jgi:RNA polymerase sigma-70 factor, ECF subfamily
VQRTSADSVGGARPGATVELPPAADDAPAATAVRRLYERHGQRVLTFCLSRMRDHEEAQDAAQTTFVYALTALERGVVPRHELGWLLTIAGNVCHTSRRTLGRRRAVTSFADVTEIEAAAESLAPETRERLDEVRRALELLPEKQRRAFLLREWQGLSYAEMADELGLSVPAVETLLCRARRALGASLERVRARLADLGTVLAGLRSLLQGGTGNVALTTALMGVAAVPVLVPPERHAETATRAVASSPAVHVGSSPVVVRHARPAAKGATAPAARRLHVARRSLPSSAAAAPTERATPPSGATPPAPAATPVAAPAPRAVPSPTAPSPIVPVSVPPVPSAPEPVTDPVTTVVSTVVGTVGTATTAVPSPPRVPLP